MIRKKKVMGKQSQKMKTMKKKMNLVKVKNDFETSLNSIIEKLVVAPLRGVST